MHPNAHFSGFVFSYREHSEDYQPDETYYVPVSYKYAFDPADRYRFASMEYNTPLFIPWTSSNGTVYICVINLIFLVSLLRHFTRFRFASFNFVLSNM